MIRNAIIDLEARYGRKDVIVWPWALGLLHALIVVWLVLVAGWIIELLIQIGDRDSIPNTLVLGDRLEIPSSIYNIANKPLSKVSSWLGMIFIGGMIDAMILWTMARWSLRNALKHDLLLRRSLHAKYHALAADQGVAGQYSTQSSALGQWIPQIRDGILIWYRSFPQHLLLSIACLIPAILIDATLTLLAIAAVLLVWRLFVRVDHGYRRRRPLLIDRIQTTQYRLQDLMARGPLLSAAHLIQAKSDQFDSQLDALCNSEREIGNSYLWKKPLLAALFVVFACLIAWIVSLRIIDSDHHLNLSGAIVLSFMVAVSAFSILRLVRLWHRTSHADLNAEKLLAILDHPIAPVTASTQPLPPLESSLSLEHVTLRGANGDKLLEDITLSVKPGQLTAIVSTSRRDAETLCELLLGFGRPIAGRILWDSFLSTDQSPEYRQGRRIWISHDGPIMSGTIRENISPPGKIIANDDLLPALNEASAYQGVFEQTDNLDTLVSASDDRLKGDLAFRLGISRAILSEASVCVAYEPNVRVRHSTEVETFQALQNLTAHRMAVVVRAQRAGTLREAGQIVVLHEHRIVDIGTHSELLERSELYRHLNYMMFSPMREVKVGEGYN